MVETASNYTNPIFSEEALNKQNEKKNRSLNIIPGKFNMYSQGSYFHKT